jgi:hypothetical protein
VVYKHFFFFTIFVYKCVFKRIFPNPKFRTKSHITTSNKFCNSSRSSSGGGVVIVHRSERGWLLYGGGEFPDFVLFYRCCAPIELDVVRGGVRDSGCNNTAVIFLVEVHRHSISRLVLVNRSSGRSLVRIYPWRRRSAKCALVGARYVLQGAARRGQVRGPRRRQALLGGGLQSKRPGRNRQVRPSLKQGAAVERGPMDLFLGKKS